MRLQNIIRIFLFVFFFSIAAAALSCAVLCEELQQYYRHKQTLRTAQLSCEKLESLIDDYDALLEQIDKDPNLIKRAEAVTLGTKLSDANTVYPKLKANQLAAARKALTKQLGGETIKQQTPDWLERICEPRKRIGLFLAGSFLIIISFVCFGPTKNEKN